MFPEAVILIIRVYFSKIVVIHHSFRVSRLLEEFCAVFFFFCANLESYECLRVRLRRGMAEGVSFVVSIDE